MTVWRADDRIAVGLNPITQGFEAGLFHPDFGNEVVAGKIFLDRWRLRFVSDAMSEEISMDVLEVEFEEGGERIYFVDPNRPDLKIFTLDQSVLKHPSLRNSDKIREHVSDVMGKREVSRALRLTVYFIVGCVVVTWLCSVSLSFMVRTIAAEVPMAWEDKFGREEIDKLQKDGELLDDKNQIAQLTELVQPLIKVLPENRRNLKFYIRNDDEPNAFALPGGYVVVHTGLLQMVDAPEQLLGVLAHELAHETQRHIIRHKIAAAGSLAVFGVFIRGKQASGSLLGMGSGILVFQGFSQRYETEADEVGWKYLVAANINPRGMIDVFKKLKAQEDAMGFSHVMPESLSSHPALSKRIARLETKWGKLDRRTGFVELAPVQWPEAKDADKNAFLMMSRLGTNE